MTCREMRWGSLRRAEKPRPVSCVTPRAQRRKRAQGDHQTLVAEHFHLASHTCIDGGRHRAVSRGDVAQVQRIIHRQSTIFKASFTFYGIPLLPEIFSLWCMLMSGLSNCTRPMKRKAAGLLCVSSKAKLRLTACLKLSMGTEKKHSQHW